MTCSKVITWSLSRQVFIACILGEVQTYACFPPFDTRQLGLLGTEVDKRGSWAIVVTWV